MNNRKRSAKEAFWADGYPANNDALNKPKFKTIYVGDAKNWDLITHFEVNIADMS